MSDPSWPSCVSVVVPARNAETTLRQAVASALAQDVTIPLEVVVAVGPSTDATEALADDLARDERVRVVANAAGSTPAALNRAVAVSRGDVIVRLDAHAVLPHHYIATALESLSRTGAANVGGRQVPSATTGFGAAVAAAMRSPLGSGAATYRSGTVAREVETVYLGVFRRDALDAVGGFDERLLRNQDYELNHRLRKAGWQIWFEPTLAVTYRPRESLRTLARQYRDYGRYKRLVMRTHPSSIRLRQLVPLFMVGGIVLTVPIGAVVGAWWLPAVTVGGYLGLVLVGGLLADQRRAITVAAALATMHWSWAVGFLQGPNGARGGPGSRRHGDAHG